MRVIGVDPGLAVTGFGIIDKINNTIQLTVMEQFVHRRVCN